jgi:hypothetical protein
VHGDKPWDLSEEKFSDFLVMSSLPLVPAGSSADACGHPLGTHHQLYRIDGKLVAVGVLDFLRSSLSSVYCFYDPELKHLALGKYSALREIQYCTEINVPYYYMGFYIHSCPKMNYKGDYSPSELLCPTTLNWFPLSDCRALLDAYKFSPFDPELVASRAAVGDELYFTPSSAKKKSVIEKSGSESESDEESDSDLSPADRAAKSEHSARMAALFGPRAASAPDLNCCPLVITGAPEALRLRQLIDTYQDMFRPLLTDWVSGAGGEVAARINVKLG